MFEAARRAARSVNSFYQKLRPLFFFLTFLAFWAIWSLPPLFQNRPVDFQAAGSIIVAYAVYNLSRTRANYEDVYRSWIVTRFAGHIKRILEAQRVSEERMNFTVDLLVHHLAEVCNRTNVDHPWNRTPSEIKETVERLNAGLATDIPFPELENAIKQASETEQSFLDFQKEFLPWMKIVWRLEVTLLIFGTLQWGYGDRLVVKIFESGLLSQ